MAPAVLHNNKLLIVDDVESNRIILRTLLEKAGYIVDECENGENCLSYLQKNMPLVLLLDLMMPGIGGLEVCKTLRTKYSKQQLPIIMITARTESQDELQGFEVGANDYINKPFNKALLLARLENQTLIAQGYYKILDQQRLVEHTLKIQQATGDALDQAVLVHDQDGNVVYYNKACVEYCNSSVPAIIAKLPTAIFDGRFDKELSELIHKIDLDKGAVILKSLTKVGHGSLDIQLVTRPIDLSETTEFYRIWTWRDMSQIRELEKQNKEKVKLETVSTFALGIAHNFNNIFAALQGAAQRIQKVNANNEITVRCLKIMSKAINNGTTLTKKMSALTKHRADGMASGGTPLKIMLESVCEVSRHIHPQASAIKFSIDSTIDKLALQVEYVNLLDIVSHIISNAIDAMENGGELKIAAFPALTPGFVEINFIDTGIGMNDAVLERVFEPFFSTKNLDEQNGVSMEGNGLGLWNVYNLVKMYAGDIEIQSQIGVGTKVSVSLPVVPGTLSTASELNVF